MPRILTAWIIPLGLLSAALSTSNAEPASPGIVLFLEPALESIEIGERRSVELRVEGVPDTGLAAFQVTITYDPSQLELLDRNAAFVASGIKAFAPLGGSPFCAPVRGTAQCRDAQWMLTNTGREAVGHSSVEAHIGAATIAYATKGSSAPATGDGVLATFEVLGKITGEVELEITEAVLADASEPPHIYAWTNH